MAKSTRRNRRIAHIQQQKTNPAYATYVEYAGMPQPRQMARTYSAYSKEGYRGCDTAYKCISYIARNGAAIPPKLYTDESMEKEIESHPLLDLLKKPNSEQSGVAYREAVLSYLLLAGNSFQYANRLKMAPPDELWTLRANTVQPVPAKNRGVVAYIYNNDKEHPYTPDQVSHLKYWHPEDDVFGLSPVEVAALNIDMMTSTKKWNLALMQNAGRPSGAWTTPQALIGKNERDRLEEKINQKYAGAQNAGKMLVFDGGLTWQSMSFPPAQMDFLDSLKYNGGSVANIYNLAPQLVGDTAASTFDNYDQAKQASYTEAIFPNLDMLYALWNVWLVPMYPDLKNAYLYYDKTSVEVLQGTIQAKLQSESERANTLWMSGLMMQDEARDLAGLPPVPGGQGKIFRIGSILVPADQLLEYAEQSMTMPAAPPPASPEPLDVEPAAQSLPGENNANSEGNNHSDHPADNADHDLGNVSTNQPAKHAREVNTTSIGPGQREIKAFDLETTEQKAAYAKSVEDARERWYGKAEKRLQEYFKQEHKAVVDAINSAAIPSSTDLRAEQAVNGQSDNLKDVLLGIYQDVGKDIGSDVLKELKSGNGPDETKGFISDFISWFGTHTLTYVLNLCALKVTQVSTNTVAKIRLELTDGVAQGESIPELAKRIDGLYLNQIIPNRSTVIARTEVIAGSNYGSQQAAKESGLTLKKVWLATEDSRTRPDHADADGQEVDLDEPFKVGGYDLMFPGDTSMGAAAKEIVQCRCTQFYKRVASDASDSTDTSDATENNEKAHVFIESLNWTHGHQKAPKNAYREFMEATLR